MAAAEDDDLAMEFTNGPPQLVITADMLKFMDDEDSGSGSESSAEPNPSPAPRPPRMFIQNNEFAPHMLVFGVFFCLVLIVKWLATNSPTVGFFVAVLVLMLLFEWERRARYSFGRVRQRFHFNMLNLIKLPKPMFSPNQPDMEPPTPYIPPEQENLRTDAATMLKRAQDMIGSGASEAIGDGLPSALLMALTNVLKSIATTTDDQSAGKKEDSSDDKSSPM